MLRCRRGLRCAASPGRCRLPPARSAGPERRARRGSRTRSRPDRARAPRPAPPSPAAPAGPCPRGRRAGTPRRACRRSRHRRPCAPCRRTGRSQTGSAGPRRGSRRTRPAARGCKSVSSRASAGSKSSRNGTSRGGTLRKRSSPVDALGELLDRPQARLAPRLGERLCELDPPPARPASRRTGRPVRWRSGAHTRPRDGSHARERRASPSRYSRTQSLTIRARRSAGSPTSRPAISALAAIRLTSHSHGPGSVSSKSFGPKISLRSGAANPAEVRDVGIAAGLHDDARYPASRARSAAIIGRRAAVERERRDEHPPVADRDELLHARGRLGREHRDGIGPVGRRLPIRREPSGACSGGPHGHAPRTPRTAASRVLWRSRRTL